MIADTVSETDPQPLCAQPNCRSLFLGRYRNAVVRAGLLLASDFAARIVMGSRWNMAYRLAMIVEHREGQEPLVRAVAGFGDRRREACFDPRDIEPLGWQVEGSGIVHRNRALCVTE